MSKEYSTILDTEFLHRLEKLSLLNKRIRKGLYSGKRRSKNQGSSIEFADYRTYNPGDDFRQIDWNAYARHEKLFLKTFLDEQELNISIYIDISKSMEYGQPNKFNKSVEIAAALGYMSLQNFDRLNVYTFDNAIKSMIYQLSGKNKVYQFFNYLKVIKLGEYGSLNKALYSGKATSGRPGISVIISDFLFEDGYKDGINFIQAANQEIILVHILNDEENDPTIEGDVRLVDSETNSKIEITLTPRAIEDYKKMLVSFKDDLTKYAFNRGMLYIYVNSEMDIETIIFNIFKKSGLIR